MSTAQQLINPFANLLVQQQQQQPQPFVFNQYQPVQQINSQYQHTYVDNSSLIDKVKNLKLANVTVYNEKELSAIFGEDVTGIDVCCVKQGQPSQIVAIKHDAHSYGNSIKTIAHFLYSCAIIEAKYGPVTKIFVSHLQFDNATNVALERNKVKSHINSQQHALTTETANYVKTLYS